jgi:ABC-type dipeptide/oligopeptide/nickel transport system permease component
MLIPTLIFVTFVTFLISQTLPGDPISLALGPEATQADKQELAKKWNLDRPFLTQYGLYIGRLFLGDWGMSIQTKRPVLDDLKAFFPATFELTLVSMIIASFAGVITGTIAAVRFKKIQDYAVRFYAMLGASIPVFWLGLVLIFIFYYKLEWLEGAGRIRSSVQPPEFLTGMYILDSLLTMDWAAFKSAVAHILLPAITLSFPVAGIIARQTRASMMEVLGENYIRYAVARGLDERTVIYKHAIKNALIPIVTVVGVLYGLNLAGAVLTETVFSWPGIGRYTVQSILFLDFQPIMGVALLTTLVYTVINLVVDVIYFFLDPRIA